MVSPASQQEARGQQRAGSRRPGLEVRGQSRYHPEMLPWPSSERQDGPGVLLDDAVDHGQTQSTALALFFGVKNGSKRHAASPCPFRSRYRESQHGVAHRPESAMRARERPSMSAFLLRR